MVSLREAGEQYCQIWGVCHCESEPKAKGGFDTVSRVGTIVFSSESLSPTAQEQSRQMHSKVSKVKKNRQCWERWRTWWPALGFCHHRQTTIAKIVGYNVITTILQCSRAVSVVFTQFLLYCRLCRKSTTDLAKQMIFLKRIIYGGFAIFWVIV